MLCYSSFLSDRRYAYSEVNGGAEEQASILLSFELSCHYYLPSLRCSEQTGISCLFRRLPIEMFIAHVAADGR